ncbi:MAG TPA: sugar transferase [Caulobacterales bacterium]|nr:sugar transferase [Caulobacterales bacterium]
MFTQTANVENGVESDAVLRPSPVVAALAPRRRVHVVTDPQIVMSARRANSPPKRILDFIIAFSALLGLLPLLIPVALAIKFTDGGPIFYGHRRIGRHGREFRCWKFRSMAVNGAEILERYFAENPEALVEWKTTQKLENDPRVTQIGKFLRATSIDELPQILNVLLGEMSIVGPRPVPRAELNERYGKDRCYYLLMRPGITGLWQVSGRSKTTYERRVALDREYATAWSLTKDVSILLRTIPAVLRADGAH